MASCLLGTVSRSAGLFEPTTLHKYSHDMRELKFEFYADESEPLVKPMMNTNNPSTSYHQRYSTTNSIKSDAINSSDNSTSTLNATTGNSSYNNGNGNTSTIFSYMLPSPINNTPKYQSKTFASSLIPDPL